MIKSIGAKGFMERKFEELEFEGAWLESMGKPERNMKVLVYGRPKNGKTEMCMQLAKYMTRFSKVLYVSAEQGVSKTLQDSFVRNKMDEVNGRIFMLPTRNYKEVVDYLAGKNSPQIVFIDSLDYLKLTSDQYVALTKRHPKKVFVIICWGYGTKPQSKYARDIEYMVDVVIQVHQFKAKIASRFGGSGKYTIWDQKPKTGDQMAISYQNVNS